MQQIVRMMYFSRFQCGVVTLPSAMSHSVWKKVVWRWPALASFTHWIRDAASVSRCGLSFNQLEDWVCFHDLESKDTLNMICCRLLWIMALALIQAVQPTIWPCSILCTGHATPSYTMLHQCWSVELCGPSFGCCTIHSISLNFSSTYNW